MKCFYHSADLDGHCSGAIVRRRYPDIELIGIDYGEDFPWDSIEEGEEVIMADFALKPFEEMLRLNARANLTWIDHHITAIDDYDAARIPIKGSRHTAFAACELAWKYFFPDEKMPMAVYFLGRHDVWDHSDPQTLPFQYGLRNHDTMPERFMGMWSILFDGQHNLDHRLSLAESALYQVERAILSPPAEGLTAGGVCDLVQAAMYPYASRDGDVLHELTLNKTDLLLEIMKEGQVILDYERRQNEKYAAACAFECMFEGLRCIAMNRQITNSQAFDSVYDPAEHDAMVTWGYRGGRWHVSLYSDKEDVDVSRIIRVYGGGGHKGAAGFQCSKLPAELRPVKQEAA